ncbi:hypothetical protein LX36DRAFT_402796 [Colletotrichum falcatum]|nr:hypothetical protein LX36DRAFT_402796 [Colletotrichum falcatum]
MGRVLTRPSRLVAVMWVDDVVVDRSMVGGGQDEENRRARVCVCVWKTRIPFDHRRTCPQQSSGSSRQRTDGSWGGAGRGGRMMGRCWRLEPRGFLRASLACLGWPEEGGQTKRQWLPGAAVDVCHPYSMCDIYMPVVLRPGMVDIAHLRHLGYVLWVYLQMCM